MSGKQMITQLLNLLFFRSIYFYRYVQVFYIFLNLVFFWVAAEQIVDPVVCWTVTVTIKIYPQHGADFNALILL